LSSLIFRENNQGRIQELQSHMVVNAKINNNNDDKIHITVPRKFIKQKKKHTDIHLHKHTNHQSNSLRKKVNESAYIYLSYTYIVVALRRNDIIASERSQFTFN
jgi:hypothetical protein